MTNNVIVVLQNAVRDMGLPTNGKTFEYFMKAIRYSFPTSEDVYDEVGFLYHIKINQNLSVKASKKWFVHHHTWPGNKNSRQVNVRLFMKSMFEEGTEIVISSSDFLVPSKVLCATVKAFLFLTRFDEMTKSDTRFQQIKGWSNKDH